MKFFAHVDYVSDAFTRSKGLEHPTLELKGYFLF
jgi:hypothetical protein